MMFHNLFTLEQCKNFRDLPYLFRRQGPLSLYRENQALHQTKGSKWASSGEMLKSSFAGALARSG